MGHVGEVDEIAEAYLYLMRQTYGTGEIVRVDGGGALLESRESEHASQHGKRLYSPAKERRGGRGEDLRGGYAPFDAVCRRAFAGEVGDWLRGHLTEVGVIAAQGPRHARELAELIEACDETIPFEVCEALAPLVVQLRNLDEAIARRTIAKLALKKWRAG